MVTRIGVEFGEGFYRKMGSDYQKYIQKALKRTVLEAEGICKKEAPVLTGNLSNHIGTYFEPLEAGLVAGGVYYWVYVQKGTSKMKANPYVTRTANKIKSDNLAVRNLIDVLYAEGVIE